jgi:hypothetical protein
MDVFRPGRSAGGACRPSDYRNAGFEIWEDESGEGFTEGIETVGTRRRELSVSLVLNKGEKLSYGLEVRPCLE